MIGDAENSRVYHVLFPVLGCLHCHKLYHQQLLLF